MQAKHLMTEDVAVLQHDQSISELATLMAEYEVRHVPIVEDGRIRGVLSDRDLRTIDGILVRDVGVEESGRRDNVLSANVETLLGRPPVTCSPDSDADTVIDLLVGERIGAVVVVDDELRVLGIISTIDVLIAARGRLGD